MKPWPHETCSHCSKAARYTIHPERRPDVIRALCRLHLSAFLNHRGWQGPWVVTDLRPKEIKA